MKLRVFLVLVFFLLVGIYSFNVDKQGCISEPDNSKMGRYNNQVIYGHELITVIKHFDAGLFILRDSSCNDGDSYAKVLHCNDIGDISYGTISQSQFDYMLTESSCLYIDEDADILDISTTEIQNVVNTEISHTKKYVTKCIRNSYGGIQGMYFEEL